MEAVGDQMLILPLVALVLVVVVFMEVMILVLVVGVNVWFRGDKERYMMRDGGTTLPAYHASRRWPGHSR